MRNSILSLLMICLTAACTSSDPQAIDYTRDQCAYCMMSISDPKFGAELVTDKGRILKYDAAECLAAHLSDGAPAHQALLAVPYDAPGTLVEVDDLRFLISLEYSSPMGANLVSFGDTENIPKKHQLELIDWAGVLNKLAD